MLPTDIFLCVLWVFHQYISLIKYGGKHFRRCLWQTGCYSFNLHIYSSSDNLLCLLFFYILLLMHSIARHKNDLLAATVITPLMSNINLMNLVFRIHRLLLFFIHPLFLLTKYHTQHIHMCTLTWKQVIFYKYITIHINIHIIFL